jgi:hypothetical protein
MTVNQVRDKFRMYNETFLNENPDKLVKSTDEPIAKKNFLEIK